MVYQLRLAHLRAERDDTEFDLDNDFTGDYPDDTDVGEGGRPRRVPPPPPVVVGAPQTGPGRPPALAPGLGVRDGREVAIDLASARGLGLLGAGAPAAARALLIAALATAAGHKATSPLAGATVVVPAEDLAGVLGRGAARGQLPSALPGALRVVADLDDALDALEAEILVRAAASRQQGAEPESWPPLVLVARPPHQYQRLQAVLDNGAPFGVLGILLGQWQPGVTCYVRGDGTISATGPGLGEALRGTRMFRLGDDDTAELLTLLHHADPDAPAEDDAVAPSVPSVPRPRIVPTQPADAGEVGLEITAALAQPARPDTELEILGPARASAPGVRPRPAAPREQPDAPRVADHDTSADDEVVDEVHADVHDEASDEASGQPAAAGEHTPPPTTGSPVDGAPDTASALITITVLGGLRVLWNPEPGASNSAPDTPAEGRGREITGALQPRTQELLVLLALHPDGATRETLVAALWGEDPPARPTNALHTALSRMRHALATATDGAVSDIVSVDNGRYRLDPAAVQVDYWRFARAVAARRAASSDHARVDAYREVVDSYGGALAEGMTCEWIEPAREAIRRDAIDAVAALARALVEHDPQQTLDLLEVARAFDPHNELLYRDIMRLQERLGRLDAIPRTLTLLTTRLAEVNAAPTPQARGLAARLGQRHDNVDPADPAGPVTSATQPGRGRSAAG